MKSHPVITQEAGEDRAVSLDQVRSLIADFCPAAEFRDKRLLLIIPDGTRTAPIGLIFQVLQEQLGAVTRALDVLVALGTHQPMSEAAICRRLDLTPETRRSCYGRVRFFNHAWNDPGALRRVGVISADEIRELSGGLFSLEVPVDVNRLVFDYDAVMIAGPVFPHEVVGFSGGNKYLFPGVAGPDIVNFFHWLGAIITNHRIIGCQDTPVRRVVDRAGSMVSVSKLCICMVVRPDCSLAGLYAGSPEAAWAAASRLSSQIHVTYHDRPFHTILSCAPKMYDELWTGGKCMYKLEPVLADRGELIIYAPHISEVSFSHGRLIEAVGYHCRDFFLKQWDQYRHHPWGVLAHCTHVYGQGTYDHGIETPRARVTLATRIPEIQCRRINLGYRDPDSIRPEDYAGREQEGILCVPHAGEILFRLRDRS
ncbi:MAG TPA: lactate racemase domain-containing protein [Candidatus Paceibacterota bacterium]|nr:lactate racemase domain-containing protein [Candidatus Paceibacterota bacterium]